jgi:hypothetical protein
MSDKYPRTFHLPWSPGGSSDDKVSKSVIPLLERDIVITEKIDGSNVCMTNKACFARTHAHAPKHESFDALKALHAQYKFVMGHNQEFFGEWAYAEHSIHYTSLPAYFLGFGVRDVLTKSWHNWDQVVSGLKLIGLVTVPVLFRGKVETEKELRKLTEELAAEPSRCGGKREGVVVRAVHSFTDQDFPKFVQKWVRKGHVQTDDHWTKKTIVRNGLA